MIPDNRALKDPVDIRQRVRERRVIGRGPHPARQHTTLRRARGRLPHAAQQRQAVLSNRHVPVA